MMSNLFSSFDPSTYYFSFNWSSTLLLILFLPYYFWFIPSRMTMIWSKLTNILFKEMSILITNNNSKKSILIFMSLFFFIMFNNFLGLFPYIFTSSSHLSFSMSLAIPLWLSFMIYGWVNKTMYMFAHLVPQGTPNLLMPFMVCIESTSNLIRPVTLAIRLSANMIAGHLLLTLLGSIGSSISIYLINFLIIIQIFLLILEIAVSIIQAYVFIILIVLYSKEVN